MEDIVRLDADQERNQKERHSFVSLITPRGRTQYLMQGQMAKHWDWSWRQMKRELWASTLLWFLWEGKGEAGQAGL